MAKEVIKWVTNDGTEFEYRSAAEHYEREQRLHSAFSDLEVSTVNLSDPVVTYSEMWAYLVSNLEDVIAHLGKIREEQHIDAIFAR